MMLQRSCIVLFFSLFLFVPHMSFAMLNRTLVLTPHPDPELVAYEVQWYTYYIASSGSTFTLLFQILSCNVTFYLGFTFDKLLSCLLVNLRLLCFCSSLFPPPPVLFCSLFLKSPVLLNRTDCNYPVFNYFSQESKCIYNKTSSS